MEKDLELIRRILGRLNYAESYVNVLVRHIAKKFEETKLPEITPNFVYTVLLPEEGKSKAKEISEYFSELKTTGNFDTNIQKILKSKGF